MTPKQKQACEWNWCLFQLNGMNSSLLTIQSKMLLAGLIQPQEALDLRKSISALSERIRRFNTNKRDEAAMCKYSPSYASRHHIHTTPSPEEQKNEN